MSQPKRIDEKGRVARSIYVDKDLYNQLKGEAGKSGVKIADEIEAAFSLYMMVKETADILGKTPQEVWREAASSLAGGHDEPQGYRL